MSEQVTGEKQQGEEGYTLVRELRCCHYSRFKDLIGRLCTLLDSSIESERQVKATKDIAKQILWEEIDKLSKEDEQIMFRFSKYLGPKRILSEWLERDIEKELEVV